MKVKFTDSFFAKDITLKLLYELFENVELSDNPDFVFCSVDYEADRYNYDCARIFLTGENIVPDFNSVDYAIGFHYLSFEDRYLRFPLYYFYTDDYEIALKKHMNFDAKSIETRKFCNFVYSNSSNVIEERDAIFELLSKYKKVDSGGRHLNNIGMSVKDKRAFQQDYKFSIAFENAASKGYVTEKLLQAFSAGTIPIYYGDPKIADEFNPKAFVNCADYASLDEAVEKIIEIDNNPELYIEMMREPIFTQTQMKSDPFSEYRQFLYNICSQLPQEAIRRCNNAWGKKVQDEAIEFYKYIKYMESNKIARKVFRRLLK